MDRLHTFPPQQINIFIGFDLLHGLSERSVKGTVLGIFHLDDTTGFLSRDDEQDIRVAGAGLGVGSYDPAAFRPQKAQKNAVIKIFTNADGF